MGEDPLSFRERKAAQIVSVQMEKIESEICDESLPSFLKGGLQIGEIAYAVFIECDSFAIQYRVS